MSEIIVPSTYENVEAIVGQWQIVLFDFDGVLCDSRQSAIEVTEAIRKDPPFDTLPSPATEGHFGNLYRGILRDALLRFELNPEQSREFFDMHAGAMRQMSDKLELFEGVAEGLAGLDPGEFAIVTSAYSDIVIDTCRRSGLDIKPESVVGHEVRATKTEKIRTILVERNIAFQDSVYIGDMESDVLYCQQVPIDCMVVSYGYHPEDVLRVSEPLAILDSPQALFKAIRKGLKNEKSTSVS